MKRPLHTVLTIVIAALAAAMLMHGKACEEIEEFCSAPLR